MLTFIARKILNAIPTFFGVVVLVFFLFHLVGGDPALQIAGPRASAKQIEEIRHELGLDKPIYFQFFDYLKGIATLDLGRSNMTHQKITRIIRDGLGPTLSISIPATLLSTLLGICFGLLVACFRGRWIDRFGLALCAVAMCIPMMAYIIFGQYFFAFKLHWFEISGYEASFPERIHYIALPVLLWVAVEFGYDLRFFRTAILEQMNEDYIRTARAKGLAETIVLFKHVLSNSMIPILTYVTMQIPSLMVGAFLLESFFGIPGLGRVTIDALNNSDFSVIKAMTLIQAFLLIVVNLLTDILYTWLDPRVKLR